MRKILLGIALLSALCGAARAADADHDSRLLTPAEKRVFYPLVCVGHARTGRADTCRSVIGNDAVTAAGQIELSLDAVAYGAFSHPGADEAYVSYSASFEPHATNYGGGLLFARANGRWRLVRWYSAGQHHPCVALPVTGVQKHLCLNHWYGSGELDSTVFVEGLPDEKMTIRVLAAQDDRDSGETDTSNYQCTLPRAPNENILLSIDGLTRPQARGILAQSRIVYATPDAVHAACLRHDFHNVRATKAILRYVVKGGTVVALSPLRFAKTDSN